MDKIKAELARLAAEAFRAQMDHPEFKRAMTTRYAPIPLGPIFAAFLARLDEAEILHRSVAELTSVNPALRYQSE